MSFLKLSFNCYDKQNNNYKAFTKNRLNLQKFLELSSLFKLYKNFSFLKRILLNEEQLSVFKTTLSLKTYEFPISEEIDHKFKNVSEYFRKNANSLHLSDIDKRILDLLKSEFKADFFTFC